MTIITLYGSIGAGTNVPDVVTAALAKAAGDEVHVHINSPGGSVWDGLAIFNALRAYEGRVVCHVAGLAASMGSAIAMAGDEVRMSRSALMMIHSPILPIQGNADGLRQMAGLMDKVGDVLADMYAARSKQSIDQVRNLMAAETWFTADEALAFGLVDAIEDGPANENQHPARLMAAAIGGFFPATATPQAAASLLERFTTMANKPATPAPKAETPPADPKIPAEEKKPAAEVDTTSADYLAGFQAGYDQAMQENATEETGEPPMAKAPVAKIGELKAAFPSDPAFALECAEKGYSLLQAKADYADVLAAKLKATIKPITATAAPIGGKALGGNVTEAAPAFASARAEFNAEVRKVVTAGSYDYAAAAREVLKARPELRDRMAAEANPGRAK